MSASKKRANSQTSPERARTTSGPAIKCDIPVEELDTLASRFIINIPDEEMRDANRVMFQVELAHWYYLDQVLKERPDLPRIKFENFTAALFNHVPTLKKRFLKHRDLEQIIEDFKRYKSNVPTYGAILLNKSKTKCLLVRGFYGKNYGFPKGKVNINENPVECAIREVREETNFDCREYLDPNEFISKNFHGTEIKLYIIPDVEEDYDFKPITQCEIRDIRWFDIEKDLPENFNQKNQNGLSFYMAIPFISELKEWIKKKRVAELKAKRKLRQEKKMTANRNVIPIPVTVVDRTTRYNYRTIHWENVRIDWERIWAELEQVGYTLDF